MGELRVDVIVDVPLIKRARRISSATIETRNHSATYGVLQSGGATKDEILNSGEEGSSFLGLGLEVVGGVELLDVLLEGLDMV